MTGCRPRPWISSRLADQHRTVYTRAGAAPTALPWASSFSPEGRSKVPEQIPDLFSHREHAKRLYSLYLCRLQSNELDEELVVACREIREHAALGPGIQAAHFTFHFEIDSLCRLGKYSAAWRQLRKQEKLIRGANRDIVHHEWVAHEHHWLLHYYAPLLYFLVRLQLGRSLQEAGLSFLLRGRSKSCDALFYVYKPLRTPRERHEVTLRHFYTRLGKSLRDWQQWEQFVRGFHPKLFELTGVMSEELLRDPRRMSRFFRELGRLREERTTSSVTRGQADLVESPGAVRQAQERIQDQLEGFVERNRSSFEKTDEVLEKLFPELQSLPKGSFWSILDKMP
jgi:hypothetical protein